MVVKYNNCVCVNAELADDKAESRVQLIRAGNEHDMPGWPDTFAIGVL